MHRNGRLTGDEWATLVVRDEWAGMAIPNRRTRAVRSRLVVKETSACAQVRRGTSPARQRADLVGGVAHGDARIAEKSTTRTRSVDFKPRGSMAARRS